jgi:hypothetical protein
MNFTRKQLHFCIAFLTLVKIILLLIFKPEMTLYEDHDIAVNLYKSGVFFIGWDGISNHTFQFPVYPFLISLIYSIFGIKTMAVAVFQVLLQGFSALMLARIFSFFWSLFSIPFCFEKYKRKVVFVSVLLFCLHPGISYYALLKIHPFTLDLFMLLLPVFLTAVYWSNPNFRNLLVLFLATGLAVLTRATLLVSILPFLLLSLKYRGFKKSAILFGGVCLSVSVICAPWLIRNYNQDKIIGFSSLTGKELWKGSLAESEGSNYLTDGRYCYTLLRPSALDSLSKMTVAGQDAYYRSLYLRNLHAHPAGQVRLYFLKLKNFWIFRSQLGNEYGPTARRYIPAYQLSYLIILLFCLFATFRIGKRSLFLMIIPVMLSLEQAVFYVETRHRLIIEPFLIFMALIGLVYLLRGRRKQPEKIS